MDLKDPLHGSIDFSAAEGEVIESREFQRLRAIKQMGFAEFSFPGATHNRFLHSVGVMHLAGQAFDQIFKAVEFTNSRVKARLRQATRLASLLHDIGHGPLSHTTEVVMPPLRELNLKIYQNGASAALVSAAKQASSVAKSGLLASKLNVASAQRVFPERADHEHFTLKYITDSPLTEILREQFADLEPRHIASLIDRNLDLEDDFFLDRGRDFRPILSQIVSSEMDVDRMDYLERDAYFCGTNYGRVEVGWLIGNLVCHEREGQVFLALNRRALYTFDDFLISRHHMRLMVYFHHKSIVYEEMLARYMSSKDCSYRLPSDINEYTRCTDFSLHEHLANSTNVWAQRIAARRPYRMLFEMHSVEQKETESARVEKMTDALESEGIDIILANSQTRLSKYHASQAEKAFPIFVVDQYDPLEKPIPIEDCTGIFKKYEELRTIDRLYVSQEQMSTARQILIERKL
jgi:uncharacterized protein